MLITTAARDPIIPAIWAASLSIHYLMQRVSHGALKCTSVSAAPHKGVWSSFYIKPQPQRLLARSDLLLIFLLCHMKMCFFQRQKLIFEQDFSVFLKTNSSVHHCAPVSEIQSIDTVFSAAELNLLQLQPYGAVHYVLTVGAALAPQHNNYWDKKTCRTTRLFPSPLSTKHFRISISEDQTLKMFLWYV